MNWYWYNKNEYIPYFYNNSYNIENAFLNGEEIYQISDRYIINFISMTQINTKTGRERELLRKIDHNKPKNNFTWSTNNPNIVIDKHIQELLNFCIDFGRDIMYYNNIEFNLKNMTLTNVLTNNIYELLKDNINCKSIKCKEGTCPICLEDNNDNSILLNKCNNHAFHRNCIGRWFNKSKLCPICKVSY